MCRITGLWDFNYQQQYDLAQTLAQMRDSLEHGGPDHAGMHLDTSYALGLGHRRLSILDLSASGNQPMYWNDWVIVFNGEVYNFKTIRGQLQDLGAQFETETDTEVLLKAFEQWGIEMVQQFRGFFAFAIYNIKTQTLTLCRDRLGVKPLYWYWKDGLFLFASELKAFHQHPHFDKSINQEAVSLFLQQGYIHQPHCIFKHAHKLAGGAYLELKWQGQPVIKQYWSIEDVYEQQAPKKERSEAALTEELEALLTESFELRMVADVPVGAFLSGGIDSSIVTALLQKKQDRQLKTFTIGFHDTAYNEAHHAKAVAQHLQTDHQEFYCTLEDFKAVVPKLPDLYDEPFGDSSAIPTYLVAKMARAQVTVSLSADGGDELFGGYTKYEITQNFYPKIGRLPKALRQSLAWMGQGINPKWLERHHEKFPVLRSYKNISNKYPKLLNALKAQDQLDFFNRASTYCSASFLQQLHQTTTARYPKTPTIDPERLISYLGMVDIATYLEGDIMTKVDRATMGVALEGREPFLDPKLLDFAMSLPDGYKIQGGSTKHLLRQVLYKHVPQELIDRPKQGFSIPIQDWLLGFLKEELLALTQDQGFLTTFELNPTILQQLVAQFVAQRKHINPHFIWFLYSLHQWYLRWIKE